MEFRYSITSRGKVGLIVFQGRLSKDTKAALEQCQKEFLDLPISYAIIYFKEVPGIDPIIFREVILLQQEIRKKKYPLCVVGLESSLKTYLFDRAVIRQAETRKDLEEAIQSFSVEQSTS